MTYDGGSTAQRHLGLVKLWDNMMLRRNIAISPPVALRYNKKKVIIRSAEYALV